MARVPLNVGYGRAIRLLCPRCGQDRLFSGFVRMNRQCSHCHLTYEREPGYFLGATYVNYGWTALSMTVAYMILRFGFNFAGSTIAPPLLVYTIAFPICFHRYARAIWLAVDCFIDDIGLPENELPNPGDESLPVIATGQDGPSQPGQGQAGQGQAGQGQAGQGQAGQGQADQGQADQGENRNPE